MGSKPTTEPSIHAELFELVLSVGEQMQSVVHGLENGPTPTQVLLLRALVGEPPMTPTELAKRVRRNKSQITRTLQEMEGTGLIERIPNPADGRSFLVQATPDVETRVASVVKAEAALVAQLIDGFSQREIKMLRKGLRRMLANL